MEYRIYMGRSIYEFIKEDLKNEEYNWYRELRTKKEDGTYEEINYFLSNNYLLRTETSSTKCEMKRYNKNSIVKIDKQYSFKEDFGIHTILDKVIIHFENNTIELIRPTYDYQEDIEGFEKIAKLL